MLLIWAGVSLTCGHWAGRFLVLNGKFTLRVTDVYERYRSVLRTAPLLMVTGEVQKKGAVVNLIAQAFAAL